MTLTSVNTSYFGLFSAVTLVFTSFHHCTSTVAVSFADKKDNVEFGAFVEASFEWIEFHSCTSNGTYNYGSNTGQSAGGFVGQASSYTLLVRCVFDGSLISGYNTGAFTARSSLDGFSHGRQLGAVRAVYSAIR